MVDIHTHVLYGLDDGAKTLEESVELVRLAAAGGTTDLVATPHSDLRYQFDPVKIQERLTELRRETKNILRLYYGCDFHLHYENIRAALEDPAKFTINQQRYLLIEFSDALIAPSTAHIFDRLQSAGMTPIITHPERNHLLQKRLDDLTRWVDAGCLLQVTAQSFLGRFGRTAKAFADQLLQRGLVHVVASDAHDPKDRTSSLAEAFNYVANAVGNDRAKLLFLDNPKATLSGGDLCVEAFERPATARSWFALSKH
jgi:protein-tyrosine phosphatase